MGQNQRRPGFLRWGEGTRGESAGATAGDAGEQAAPEQAAPEQAAPEMPTPNQPATALAPTVQPPPGGAEATPFLRDLVGAMRGVAESSRDTTLAELREAVEKRVAELGSGAAERAEGLRRRSEQDLNGIGDWERAELERVRTEAEQRREARRAQLEKELADQQAGADAEAEAARARLTQYEQELEAFFAQLSAINDPAAFVSAAKRMPPPPDLAATQASAASAAASAPPAATATEHSAESEPRTPAHPTEPNGDTLARRLAQLNERLGSAPAASEEAIPAAATPAETPAETVAATPAAPAAPAAVTATVAPSTPSTNGTAAEASTPIVVKGLGSFGAITSFKQALERVDGISGVTLSLGPTGDFVYRASHSEEFDIVSAIRSIEGQSAEITQVDGQLRVTIERPR